MVVVVWKNSLALAFVSNDNVHMFRVGFLSISLATLIVKTMGRQMSEIEWKLSVKSSVNL